MKTMAHVKKVFKPKYSIEFCGQKKEKTRYPVRHTNLLFECTQNTISTNSKPTVELKAIATNVLKDLQDEGLPVSVGGTFQSQLNQIDQIKARQLSDFIEVCVLRLHCFNPEEESTKAAKVAEDHLCILKAILSL